MRRDDLSFDEQLIASTAIANYRSNGKAATSAVTPAAAPVPASRRTPYEQQPQSTTRAEALERVLIAGDLAQLAPSDRIDYYRTVCESLNLNPLTKPFEYINLNGKLVLYAKRDCTDQLRSRDRISIRVVSRELLDDVYVVTAQARTPDGREDESTGAVPVANLKGDAKANAYMKAETKAKRRVTLSICGLGLLDECEIESIPGARKESDTEMPPIMDRAAAVEAQKIVAAAKLATLEAAPKPPQTEYNPPITPEELSSVRRGEVRRAFDELRERIGETRWDEEMEIAGVTDPMQIRYLDPMRALYKRLVAIAKRDAA